MVRGVRRAAASVAGFAATLAATLTVVACEPSGHANGTAPSAATYRCPSAARAAAAVHSRVDSVRRSPFQDRTVTCDYLTAARAPLIVGVTFDAGTADLTAAIGMLPGVTAKTELPGVGDGAYLLRGSGDEPAQLFARFGDRLLSVTGGVHTTRGQLVALAELAGR